MAAASLFAIQACCARSRIMNPNSTGEITTNTAHLTPTQVKLPPSRFSHNPLSQASNRGMTISRRTVSRGNNTSFSSFRWRRQACLGLVAVLAAVSLAFLPEVTFAQDISIDFGDDTTLTERAIQLIALITVLALAPSILVMVTSFTRIVVVLSLLRTAIGLQTAPPNSVMISLALFLTAFIMAPTLQESYDLGIEPVMAGNIEITEAFELSAGPVHAFMRTHVREQDVMLFMDLTE